MFHDIVKLYIEKGTKISVLFEEGTTKQFDMASTFKQIPQLEALKDRKLFEQAYLKDPWGISWNDELDFDGECIYQDGTTVPNKEGYMNFILGYKFKKARLAKELSQQKLSKMCKIDQGDISKIENGVSSISLSTMLRLAKALDKKLNITLE